MDEVLHRLSDIEPMDDGHGFTFTLIDSEGEPAFRFVYDTEQQARQGAKFAQALIEHAVGIVPAGPF